MGRFVFLLRRRRPLTFWGAGFNLPDVLVHAGQVRQLLHYRTVALTLVLGSDSRGVYFLRALDRGGVFYGRVGAASA